MKNSNPMPKGKHTVLPIPVGSTVWTPRGVATIIAVDSRGTSPSYKIRGAPPAQKSYWFSYMCIQPLEEHLLEALSELENSLDEILTGLYISLEDDDG